MSHSIRNILMTSLLGAALVGCSSTPKPEEAVDAKPTAVETNAAKDNDANSVDLTSKQTQDMSGQELLAAIDGKAVYFDFDRSEIKEESYELIKAHAEYLAKKPKVSIKVQGHCDERGSREYNLALGERRGNAVKNALMAYGVDASRITVISYGEDRPVDDGHNEEAWSKNRRAEFVY